jgi:hypothetical protein
MWQHRKKGLGRSPREYVEFLQCARARVKFSSFVSLKSLANQLFEMSEPKIEEYAKAFRELEREGIDIRALFLGGIRAVIGESGTSAIVFHLGDKALMDPGIFVRRLVQIFGVGSFMLLDGMIARAADDKDSSRSQVTKNEKGQS